MAQKKTTGKKTASKKGKDASKKGRVARYRLDKEGRLIGPDGRIVALEAGDIPIIINGGSLSIVSVGALDDGVLRRAGSVRVCEFRGESNSALLL